MYNTFVQFFNAINFLLPANTQYAQAVACWQVYQNARDVGLDMLAMGRINRLGPQEIANLGATSQTQAGSILISNEWSIAMNDSWVIGGIHGHQPFHLASETIDANIINLQYQPGQAPERIFTVTGRELLGITTFGYSIHHQSELLGTVLTCTEPMLANGATFQAYRRQVQAAATAMVT